MANQKKFGTFAGVFTPSLLTILGVIMYMRMGWVVGQAGLVGTIAIVVIAHIISITTGLSISSIATDKKVGAGGVYYVLSRSLGLPIGGAIGMTLFTGTALSIALYLIGFAESFNAYLGLDSGINGLRIGGSLALLTLTILALISTSLALKAQFFIMAAIVISLIAIFFGTPPAVATLPLTGAEDTVSMEMVFAVFFPAVTGFTAGIAMSGDLKDPKQSIPNGTLWAIGVGFAVYLGLAVFLFFTVDGVLLRTDNNIMLKLALFAPAVVAGIWGATLSSALGGILGGPRILQAMSVDKITPRRFAKGVGKDNEPRNALFLTVIIAQAGILIGELDTIARVCSMFYLAAYGFINLSFYLESWASSDFNPTFKVKKWIGLVGFIATFTVMFRLDMMAMVVAFIVIGGIYFWLAKKELALGSGDVWRSVWSSVVKTGLRRMDEKQDHKRNWKPNVLLFSGGTNHRPYLLEFSKELVGNRGIVTNFDLYENQEARVLFPKHKQSVTDDLLRKYGVFGRQIEVKNVFKGIETIASTFGFSGIEPNTILMGWAKNTKDPIWFAQMTQKLIDLDYNVLYLDYDERFGFRKYEQIDLWWRGVGNNAELMLNISKFLLSSEGWRNAQIRVLLVDSTHSNKKLIEKKIRQLLDDYRVPAVVKIIGNVVDERPIYELMKIYSSEAALVLVGIPGVKLDEADHFVRDTNDLVGTIGTTLLVKASSRFDDLDFIASDGLVKPLISGAPDPGISLPAAMEAADPALEAAIATLEAAMTTATHTLVDNAISPIQEKYIGFHQLVLSELQTLVQPSSSESEKDIYQQFSALFQRLEKKLQQLRTEEIPILGALFLEENNTFLDSIEGVLGEAPVRLKYQINGSSGTLKFQALARFLKDEVLFSSLRNTYIDFGNLGYENLSKTHNELIAKINSLLEVEAFYQHFRQLKSEIEAVIEALMDMISKELTAAQTLTKQLTGECLLAVRTFRNELVGMAEQADLKKQKAPSRQARKVYKSNEEDLLFFPNHWRNNQEVIHSTLETNLKLTQANLLVNKGLGALSEAIEGEVNGRIEAQFEAQQATLQALIQEHKSKEEMTAVEKFSVDDSAFVGLELLLQILKKETHPVVDIIKGEAALMGKTLMEDFEALQLEGLQPIILDLPKIVDFILESKLNGPVQLQLEQYLRTVTNIYFNQINGINLLKYSLSESKKESEIKQLLESVQAKFSEEKVLFQSTKLRFNEKLRAIAYDLQMELDTRYLIEHADNWSRYISVSKRKKGLANINEQIKSKLSDWYEGINRGVSAKRYESTVSIFESKYDLKSKLELGLDFVNAMYPPQAVLETLPFYYKQLFQGKHLPVQHRYIGRDSALDQVDNALLEGRKGAILIVGKSSSGKTHFSDFIAHTKFKGKVFTIDSYGKQGNLRELHREMAAATGKSGEMEQCLSSLAKNSTIVLNDIEVWWDRTLEKDALSVLIEMIEKFQHKHTFILNVNLYAMEAMRKQTLLQKVVTTTITLPPVSKDALKTIILERHKVGGLDLVFQGEENRLEGKHFNQLMHKIYTESNGNIGLGLQLWLRQIYAVEDMKIYMKEQPKLEVLKVNEDYWKLLLYQMLMNKNLTKTKLSNLFGEDLPEEAALIKALMKAEILEEVRKNVYTLDNVVKPNIEAWLTSSNVLN
ncbi:MAG: hypothetical protein R2828_06630 [Saprospiraceae bacterium]